MIPIAALLSVLVTFGLLSRNSELTVMKACGISLYRASLSVIVLSLVFSVGDLQPRAAGAGAGEPQGRGHRRQDSGRPRVFDAMNRQWVLGRDGAIYHYSYFNPEGQELAALGSISRRSEGWSLRTETMVEQRALQGPVDRPAGAHGGLLRPASRAG